MKSAQMKERELIIKLYNDGKKQEEIASMLGCSQSKVSFWIIRHKKTGSLENRFRSGRPSNFSDEKLSLIKSKIVKKLGIETCWKTTRYEVTNSKYFSTIEKLKSSLMSFWQRNDFMLNFTNYLCP